MSLHLRCDDCDLPLGMPLVPRNDPGASLCSRCLVSRHYVAERAAEKRRRDWIDSLIGLVVGIIVVACLHYAMRGTP